MKVRNILYPMVPLFLIILPIMRYYASTPWVNACVLDYVDNMEESDYKWYMYDINGVKHIEPANSRFVDSLAEYKIWEADWCLMASDNLLSDLNNTFYCTVSYLIKKAPIDEKLKEPLGILKEE